MFASNDNILSEYANYSQYFNQLFIFFCTSIAVKACTIDHNLFARLVAPASRLGIMKIKLMSWFSGWVGPGDEFRGPIPVFNQTALFPNYRQPIYQP
jgi:hypothetical protein